MVVDLKTRNYTAVERMKLQIDVTECRSEKCQTIVMGMPATTTAPPAATPPPAAAAAATAAAAVVIVVV